jgi:hypothetical protein
MIPIHSYLGYFGDVLSGAQVLEVGQPYTFTFSFPWYSQYPSSSEAMSFLGSTLSGAANVISASRGLFSGNFVVTIVPTAASLTVDDLVSAFSDAWKSAPWYIASPTFVQAEGGAISTQPGGVSQLLPEVTGEVGQVVGQSITAAIKPLLPYILLGVGGYLFLTFGLPKLLTASKVSKVKVRVRRRKSEGLHHRKRY